MFSNPAIISSSHDLRHFDCGAPALNEFLVKYALANNNAGLARTFVTTLLDQPTVVGYFSIAAGSVEREMAPERIAKGTAKHPIPVGLLARLAVDVKYQGQKLGEGLLKQALLKIVEASHTIGIRAVLVHAKNQKAADFYAKYGFVPSPSDGTLELVGRPELPPGLVRVRLEPAQKVVAARERLPDRPWFDESIAAPIDLPRPVTVEHVEVRHVVERLPERHDLVDDGA